jgi:hypothetical protein
MEEQSFGTRLKNKTMKIIRKILIWAILIGIAAFSIMYFVSYEDGFWAGKISSVSKKGVIFKTYEGKINLETFGSLKGVSPIVEIRDFSVEKSNPALIKELEEVALRGERVNLFFVKYYFAFPWRGDTKYFATKVERLGNE